MLGKPKYKIGDIVQFDFTYQDKEYHIVGKVEIIDAYGTFEQNKEVSYDVMADSIPFANGGPTLFKHIIETNLKAA